MTNVVNLDPPAPEDTLVRLLNSGGCDELNIAGKAYHRDHRGAFHVEQKHVSRELLTVGAFYHAPITKQESLQDVASAVLAMPACPERDALKSALAGLFEAVD
jgi:hypothetical protein